MSEVRIFISCVSAEFGSYRDALCHYLTRPNVTVKVQEHFIVTGTETLDMLDDYIRQCEVVIHLVGDMTGAMAQPPSVAAIRERYADFAQCLPELAPFLEAGGPPLSYTQWEAWLALYHRRRLIIAGPQEPAQRDDRYRLDPAEQAAQQAHLARLARVGRYPGFSFTSADQFAAEVWRSGLLDLLIEAGLVRKVVHLRYLSLGDLFKGRASLLDDLGTRLGPVLGRTDRRAAVTVLTGIGGVGKTRLAVEYAWRQAGDYTAMLLIGADSDAALNTNLAALCGATILDLPERDETDEVRRRDAVVRWLQAHQGWLLILENVDSRSAASTVKTLLPQLLGGHVLITSQLSNWPASITVLPVDLLSPEAATDFLLTRTQGGRRTGSDDRERAHDLAHELGYLPLALEQAGAYIATLSLSFAQYGERWQRQRDAVLAWYDPEQMDYPKSVAITWRTSFEQLGASARQLLRRLAWLAPEPVPESLLEVQVRGADSSGTDPTEVDPLLALAELRSYSLVTRSANVPEFSIHRLVQEISRRDQREDCTQDPLIETLNWVNDAFVGDPHDVRSWSILDPLVPHARTVAGWADEAEIADPTARLLNQLGGLLLDKALYAEAEPLMRRALEIDEMAYGHDDPRVAAHLSNLGQLLAVTNRLPQAELLMRRALLINETSYGPEHPIVAVVLNNLASLLTDTNRLAEAEPLMLRVLAIDMASYGPKHPRIACDLNNLAQLLQVTNRLPEAELLMRRALAIDEENYGLENPEVAVALGNLGLLLRAKNWLTEAEPLFRRALVINEEAYGPEHPTVAIALNNLAVLLQDMKRLDEAYPLIIRALAINEARYGPKHPTVAITLNNLAQLLQATNRFAEAEQLMRRALAIDEASYGPEHSSVVIDLGNLAMLLWAKNRLAEAEPLMRQALSLSVRLQGGENPPPQDIGENYVDLLQAMGKTEDEIHAAFASLFE